MGSDIYLEFIVFITPSIALLARSNLISIDESIGMHGLVLTKSSTSVSWCSNSSIIPKQRWVSNYSNNLFPDGGMRLQSQDKCTVRRGGPTDKKLGNTVEFATSLNDIRRMSITPLLSLD